jgi:tyrosine-protein kinase Etk/Wzc
MIDDQIKTLNVTEDVGPLNIIILEVARTADKPSKPQKSRAMAFALIIGTLLGGGLSLSRDMMDQKLHSAEEISNALGLPLLGVVPSMSRKENVVERGQKVYLDPRSFWAEAYRTIRTAIFFSALKEKTKTILVTSPAPSDGKTTLASNLAITMAQAGQKTLILDADFRKPMLHNIFGINHSEKGIISFLTGEHSLSKVIKASGVKGLGFLSRGPDVPNPSEVLNSAAFAKLIEYLSEKFDRIIIDSPPVSPVTDAQILAAICDTTILVLRSEKSTIKVSRHVRDVLLSVGANVLGVVVNDVPRKNNGYYIGYQHYYGSDNAGKMKIAEKNLKKAVAL